MAKLYFRYGAMGSSKTANALMVHYNYEEKGQNALLLKPRVDSRDGAVTIRSRIGLSREGMYAEDFLENVKTKWLPLLGPKNEKPSGGEWTQYQCIIVDEAQFLSGEQIDLLSDVVDYFDIPVICYGLRTDFTGSLFEGAKRLFEVADRIEEIPTVCWCGRRAHFNARFSDGKILRTGEQIFLGANESYVSLCRKHFKEGNLGGKSR
ncbi:MAG: thymidine kinase [Lachnospiraceae bacterium]|nr:thymidine kinase [Lachnospiraceae bacterium]